jgi:hypothetical protein
MAYDLSTIRATLKTLFETISEIAFVYDRRNPTVEGYPCIIFDIEKNESEMLTNTQNLRTITFRVWVMTEIPVGGASKANDILDNATTAVVEAVENITNLQLGGDINWLPPVEGARQEVSSPTGNLIWQILDLRCRIISSVL